MGMGHRLWVSVCASIISAIIFSVAICYPKLAVASEEKPGITIAPALPPSAFSSINGAQALKYEMEPDQPMDAGESGHGLRLTREPTEQERQVSQELLSFIEALPQNEYRLFLKLLDDPASAALLMMAAKHPRFRETLHHFRIMPNNLRDNYMRTHRVAHDAFEHVPATFKTLYAQHDIDDLPLSASLDKSARKVFLEGNSLYLSYLMLNLMIWSGTNVAAAFQSLVIPDIWRDGSLATVYQDDMSSVCDLVFRGQDGFEIQGPLMGGLQLSGGNIAGAATVGIAIAAFPAVAQSVFMPLVMIGVLSAFKLAYKALEHRQHAALHSSATEDLKLAITSLEERLGSVNVEQLMLSQETREVLQDIAEKPGLLLPVAVGLSRLNEQEFDEVSAAIISISLSLNHQNETEKSWKQRLMRLLHIAPYTGGSRPRTSGIANSLYNLFANKKYAHLYVPLVLGTVLALSLHGGVAMGVGILAPYIDMVGGATATVVPTGNLTALCSSLAASPEGVSAGANILGTLTDFGGSIQGAVINTFAANFVATAMDKLYGPLQRILTNPTSRRMGACVMNVLRCGRKSQRDKDHEAETELLQRQVERMHIHTRDGLRRRVNVSTVRTIPKSGQETEL